MVVSHHGTCRMRGIGKRTFIAQLLVSAHECLGWVVAGMITWRVHNPRKNIVLQQPVPAVMCMRYPGSMEIMLCKSDGTAELPPDVVELWLEGKLRPVRPLCRDLHGMELKQQLNTDTCFARNMQVEKQSVDAADAIMLLNFAQEASGKPQDGEMVEIDDAWLHVRA